MARRSVGDTWVANENGTSSHESRLSVGGLLKVRQRLVLGWRFLKVGVRSWA